MKITKKKWKSQLDFISTLWIILSTGSLCYCIFNMKLSMFVLLLISLTYLLVSRSIKSSLFYTAAGILGFVFINSIINIRYFEFSDDIIILIIRVFSLMIIFNSLSKERFMKYFCDILFFLCCLSLLCFVISEAGIQLPGETTIWFKDKYYIYTFYHTIGRWTVFHRNAGVFWESPAFAIFINIAIIFLMFGNLTIDKKRRNLFFIIYSITIFTTLATTAYLEYLIVLVAIVFNQRYIQKSKKEKGANLQKYTILLIILAALISLTVIESNLHIIETKLINGYGSVNERRNDTLSALNLAMQRPLFGFGMFNSYTYKALLSLDVTDNSNSFSTSFLYFGFPMGLLYIGWFIRRIFKFFDCNVLSKICLALCFIVFLNTEQINVMTLFVALLFPMLSERKNPRGAYENYIETKK